MFIIKKIYIFAQVVKLIKYIDKMEIEGKKIKWRKLVELPMDKQMCKKVLLLVEGRFSGKDSLHVVTDYWHVCFDKKYFNWDLFYKKEKIGDKFSYGKMEEKKVPMDKVVGWMFAEEIIPKTLP